MQKELQETRLLQVKHDALIKQMSADIHEIRKSIDQLARAVETFANYATGRKAIFRFVIGVGGVISAIIGSAVAVVHIFKAIL